MGLAPKSAAVDIAKLRKDEGKAADTHIKSLSVYEHDREDLERERREWQSKPDLPEKLEQLRLLDQREKDLETHTDDYEKNEVHAPGGKKQFQRLRNMVRDAADFGRRLVVILPALHLMVVQLEFARTWAPCKERVTKEELLAKDGKQSQKEADESFLAAAGVNAQQSQKASPTEAASGDLPTKPQKMASVPAQRRHPRRTNQLSKSG